MTQLSSIQPTTTTTLPPPAPKAGGEYVVRRGDTLSAIAQRFGTNIVTLQRLNHIPNRDIIHIGQRLILPADAGHAHIVQRGDTLSALAKRNGTSVAAILSANPSIHNANVIYPGDRIVLPHTSAPTPPRAPARVPAHPAAAPAPPRTNPTRPTAPVARPPAPVRAGDVVDRLGDIITRGEGNYESYNTGTRGVPGNRVGHSYVNPPAGSVTNKTVNQILATVGLPGTDSRRMFATGKYQTTLPTLRAARDALGLTGNERYTPAMQERVFREFLLEKAGDGKLADFVLRGIGSVDQAQLAAAKEWASIRRAERIS